MDYELDFNAVYSSALAAHACSEELKKFQRTYERGGWEAVWKHPEASHWACWYADRVIKGPWPLGEEAIASSPHYSLVYARDVIGGPWPLGEAVIVITAKK